ncbi:4-diphosphocytidyl-2C-methyl-D-erythritol kinase [Phycicoccus sp. Root563]|uniref:4-(cytidine 5'-diphospho)-2-C-methyl-D-erythritol kinase n=1 Tax=unclassified Phycicoccus TaxID=2637926 RepID=UPI000702CB7F|nr:MULTISPECIES: 4-(cytidine 5'-diphospho)-2-C-methyl-D-erythritol kinase [unclassified Phycicoccus]KQU67637.1 4-diphosphocytidyl-2C-methyl-D-erythritol kinase [Phycicoccus sp. Root101]KQZ90313.1 4-diphosphocytidyl-2C-methyl-D-erythritol kinase [Phycicoccus sp. Root563]
MTSAAVMPSSVTVRVPAKVNLELLVGAPREDGYHPLATVYHAVSLYDEVTVAAADDWGVGVSGPQSLGVPVDESNLALRAARMLAEVGEVREPVHVSIRKDIPVMGGMAGGSADAAAALVACDRLWGLALPRTELEHIAAELGSDVPFLLSGGTSMGSGRGEVLAPVLARGSFHWVFALSETGLSTPAVYAECDRLRGDKAVKDPSSSPQMMQALRSGDPRALGEALQNDLQAAAISLMPALGDVLDAGLEFGALGGVVSGSGPTVAFVVENNEAALDLAVSLTASGAVQDVRRATGPAHGAHEISGPRPG